MPVKWDDILAGGAGAVDEALFGIPEWLLKKVNREGVEKYIKAHEPAYRTGETIGTIGSMFVPIPGLGAVGAAGKAAKAAKGIDTALDVVKAGDTALDLAKIAKGADAAGDVGKTLKTGIDWTKLGKYAKTGAASGAIESGIRGVTGEKTPEQILRDIQTGALFGAGGGVLGGAVADNLPRWMSELSKTSEKAYLGTTDLARRQALAYLKDAAGPGAKGIGKLKAGDQARKELVRVGKEIGAHIPGKMDDAILAHSATWKALDDIVEKVAPNVRGSDLYTAAINKLDMPALYKEFGEDTVNAFLKDVLAAGTDRSGLANARGFLQDLVKASYSEGNIKTGRDAAIQRMQRTIAQDLRSGVDDLVMDTAKKAGANIDFEKLKRDYLPMRALAESGAIDDIAPLRVNAGSQTAEKLAAQQLASTLGMAGLGGAAGYGASDSEDVGDKIKAAAIGGLGGALGTKAIGTLATKGIAAAQPLANLLETAVGKAAPEALSRIGSQAGGEAAAIVAAKAVAETAPTTPKEAEAATVGAAAGSGDQPAYVSKVLQAMRDYAAMQGVAEDSPEFQTFAREIYTVTNGFSPQGVAPILYRDPAERAAFLKALDVSKKLSGVVGSATASKQGLFDFGGDQTQKIERAAAVDQLASIVGDVAKERGSEKAAKVALQKILGGNESPERKQELVKILLAQYGVDLDELSAMGVA